MTDLALELLLFLLLAAAIGWFIGRFLCKNCEYLERAKKQELEKKLATINTEQVQRQLHIDELSRELNQQKLINTELEQENENLDIHVTTLRSEQKKLLKQVKTFEASHISSQTLNSEYAAAKKKLEGLQIMKINQRTQNEKLEENAQTLNKKLKRTELLLQAKQEELNRATTDIQQQKRLITELEQDRRALAKLQLNYEETCSRLKAQELDQQNMNKNHLKLKKEYQQLHNQCETLHFDGLQATERFNFLQGEKEQALREIEHLKLERKAHMERLRAISNVINIVEPDKSTPLAAAGNG